MAVVHGGVTFGHMLVDVRSIVGPFFTQVEFAGADAAFGVSGNIDADE